MIVRWWKMVVLLISSYLIFFKIELLCNWRRVHISRWWEIGWWWEIWDGWWDEMVDSWLMRWIRKSISYLIHLISSIISSHLPIDYTAPTPSWSYFNSEEQGDWWDGRLWDRWWDGRWWDGWLWDGWWERFL